MLYTLARKSNHLLPRIDAISCSKELYTSPKFHGPWDHLPTIFLLHNGMWQYVVYETSTHIQVYVVSNSRVNHTFPMIISLKTLQILATPQMYFVRHCKTNNGDPFKGEFNIFSLRLQSWLEVYIDVLTQILDWVRQFQMQ